MSPKPSDFLRAEAALSGTYGSDVELYEAIHQAAGALVVVDAFYICLYEAVGERLHYVYNVEAERFDKPESFPLGNGPTSRVVREGRPFVMADEADRQGLTFRAFADVTTVSRSAIHWPLWINVGREDSASGVRPDLVISVQSYAFGAYDEEARAAFEWLTRRVEEVLRARRRSVAMTGALEQARLAASRDRAVADVAQFVSILEEIAALREDPKGLLMEVRRRQVELIGWAPTADVAQDELGHALDRLSLRELEVLAFVAQGMSNEEVAEVLMCSKHTVKRHLDNVYRETPLRNRSAVAGAAAAIQRARVTRSGD